jgi:NAD-dependent SIR2 family protein deacetylase
MPSEQDSCQQTSNIGLQSFSTKMSEVVFIFGAGASKQAGAPLMRDFLDTAEHLKRSGRGGSDQQQAAFDLVFKGVSALQSAFAKANLDTDNLEAVFAAFEMAQLFKALPPLTAGEVAGLSDALRTLIVRTLEQQIEFPIEGAPGGGLRVEAPLGYRNLVEGLNQLRRRTQVPDVAMITFNYDLALDYTLFRNNVPIDYCLDPSTDSASRLPVMKLHGSLNWARCEKCRRIVPIELPQYFQVFPMEIQNLQPYKLEVGQRLTAFAHCPGMAAPHVAEPIIVPPTWSKTTHYEQIAIVWQHAAKHLSSARHIFVVGYSLPETDHFFRYLYALGTVSAERLQDFCVVDIDRAVEQRFSELLGPLAKRRFRLRQGRFLDNVGELINCTANAFRD